MKGRGFALLVLGFTAVVALGAGAVAEEDGVSAALRSRVVRLKHLANSEARGHLESLRIGTHTDLLPHNSLIVTAGNRSDLDRASNLLRLADSGRTYKIDVISEWPGTQVMPSSELIAGRWGKGPVGTLTDPPALDAAGGVIIDICNGKVIAAAPADTFESVKGAFAAAIGAPASGTAGQAREALPPTKNKMDISGPEQGPVEDKSAEAENAVGAAPEQPATLRLKGGLFDGWGPATVSAQTLPIPLAAQEMPLAAEAEDAGASAEAEPNTIGPETAAEGATEAGEAAEAAEEAGQDGSGTVQDDNGAAEAADAGVETGDAAADAAKDQGTEAAEETTGTTADETKEGTEAGTAPGRSPEDEAAMMQLMKLLGQSQGGQTGAAEAGPAQDNGKETTPATEAGKETTEGTGANAQGAGGAPEGTTTAPRIKAVRPPLPTPKGPAGPRTAPQPTTSPSKIETRSETDAATESTTGDMEADVQTVIVLPEKVRILDLIELVGKQLGINYIYDPKDVTGEVMLKIHDGKIKVKDMYALLETVLKFKNLAMTRREAGNLVMIMPVNEAAVNDPVLRRDSSDIQPGDVIVTMIHQLKNIDTATAQQMLTNMKLGIAFNAIEETQTLIITDYAYRLPRIEEILKLVDVKGKMRKFHSRELKYLRPSDMAAKVMAIAQQMGTISITVSQEVTVAAPPAAPTPPGVRTPVPVTRTPVPVRPAPTATKQEEGVYLDTDDRTNRILMVGLEEDIETVNMIIDSLDVEKSGLKTIKEYPMQYVEAGDVLETMYELGIISGQPTSRTSMLPSRMGSTTRTTITPGTVARTPVTTAGATYTPTGAPAEGEPQISVRMSTNSLLVNATAEQHREIAMVIKFVDTEQQEIRTVQEYEIQYVDIQEVVDTLSELGIIASQGTSTQQSARRAGTSSSMPTSRLPTAMPTTAPGAPNVPEGPSLTTFETATGAEITSDQPQIAVLESTNSLLVYATPKQHETISLVVAHVDRELTAVSTPYVVYALENQDPEELAATLNEIIQATVPTPKSPDSKIQTQAPGAAGAASAGAGVPPKREKNDIQIVPDPKSYSLIVYADKKNQQWVGELIKQLDQYRPQVHLDVTLVEITKDDQFNYDLKLVTKLPEFIAGGAMESGGLITALVPTFPDGHVAEASSKGGSGAAFFSDKHIQALLNLVDSKNYGRILARPSLLVKDNQAGEIKAEKTIYIGLSKTTTIPSTTTNPVPITDVTFEPYTSGVTLSITPHIASEKILQLEITLDRTDFVDGTGTTTVQGDTYSKPLDTVSSNLGTWAVLPDGATIILGGIESISQSKGTDKIPLLGDIPLIGGLFRGVNNTDRQSRLYVFVKATILRPGDEVTGESDIEKLSLKKREAFERDEAHFQNLEGVIPRQKTRPLEPERILEDGDYVKDLKAGKEEAPVSVEVRLGSGHVAPGAPLQSSPGDLVDDTY